MHAERDRRASRPNLAGKKANLERGGGLGSSILGHSALTVLAFGELGFLYEQDSRSIVARTPLSHGKKNQARMTPLPRPGRHDLGLTGRDELERGKDRAALAVAETIGRGDKWPVSGRQQGSLNLVWSFTR